MAKPDSVYSLFGLKDPQETAREYYKQAFAYNPGSDPYTQAGAGFGKLFTAFLGVPDAIGEQAKLQEIAQGYQPGNLQNMAETYTRLKEAGAPAETLSKLSGDITAASSAFNEKQQAIREAARQKEEAQTALNAGTKYIMNQDSELGKLVQAKSISVKDAIDLLQKSKKGTEAIDLAKFLGMPNNVLQSFDPASVKKANLLRLQGPKEGEPNLAFVQRVNDALMGKPEKVKPVKELTFEDFSQIPATLLDSYSAGSRLQARQEFAKGKNEGESDNEFRLRVLGKLLVGLTPQQKKRAEELSQSARVAVDGQPAFNKFFNSVDEAFTGPGAEGLLGFGRLINAIGGSIEGVPETEYVQKFLSAETLNAAQFMKGALSNADIDFLKERVGRLGNTAEGLKQAFAELEARKLLDQIVYEAYMNTADKANFNEADIVRQYQEKVYNRVRQNRGVNF